MKSKSEKFCKASFDTYLRKKIPTANLFWTDIEQKDEPPDYYLAVNDINYAVEVTILIQKMDVGANNHLPGGTIRDLLDKFIKEEVALVAKKGDYLRGAYLVSISKPITNFSEVKEQIKTKLLLYISDTLAAIKASPKMIYKNSKQECVIEKLHSKDDKVVMGGPYFFKSEGEALEEAKQILNERLEEKKYKLRNISLPKILLLHDKYFFADHKTYRACISKVPLIHSFHTVFVTGSVIEGEILFSHETAWA